MASVKLEPPRGRDNEALYDCLCNLIDELNYILVNISSENLDSDTADKIESKEV